MSELAKRLKMVDPNLTIISGHRRKAKQNFDACGDVYCPGCHEESVRFINGLCPSCSQKLELKKAKKMELKAREKSLRSIFRARRLAAHKD